MKLQWGIFLGLLLIPQIIGQLILDKNEPVAALCIIAYPSSILIGAFYSYLFFRNKTALLALPLLLMLVQIQIVHAPRNAPRDSLIIHAMSQFLGYQVTHIESYLGGCVLMFFMLATAVISAFLAAEIEGRLTRQPHVRGLDLLRGSWKLFLRWEKTSMRTANDE